MICSTLLLRLSLESEPEEGEGSESIAVAAERRDEVEWLLVTAKADW